MSCRSSPLIYDFIICCESSLLYKDSRNTRKFSCENAIIFYGMQLQTAKGIKPGESTEPWTFACLLSVISHSFSALTRFHKNFLD